MTQIKAGRRRRRNKSGGAAAGISWAPQPPRPFQGRPPLGRTSPARRRSRRGVVTVSRERSADGTVIVQVPSRRHASRSPQPPPSRVRFPPRAIAYTRRPRPRRRYYNVNSIIIDTSSRFPVARLARVFASDFFVRSRPASASFSCPHVSRGVLARTNPTAADSNFRPVDETTTPTGGRSPLRRLRTRDVLLPQTGFFTHSLVRILLLRVVYASTKFLDSAGSPLLGRCNSTICKYLLITYKSYTIM